jgi:hypothetical protein
MRCSAHVARNSLGWHFHWGFWRIYGGLHLLRPRG